MRAPRRGGSAQRAGPWAGKARGEPVWALLGGKVRENIRLYANGWYRTGGPPREYAEDAERVVRDGFTALKFDPFQHVSEWQHWRPRRIWERGEIEVAARRVAAVREAVGPEVEILLEGHGWFDVNTAAEVGAHYRMVDHAYELDAEGGTLVLGGGRPGLGVELDEAYMAPHLVETVAPS